MKYIRSVICNNVMNYVLNNDDLRRLINDFACGANIIFSEYEYIFKAPEHTIVLLLNPFLLKLNRFSKSKYLFTSKGVVDCTGVFPIEPMCHKLHDRLKSILLVETDDEQSLRLKMLGPMVYEVNDTKKKYPPHAGRGLSMLHRAARADDLPSVKILLRSGEFDVTATTTKSDMTALHFAASSTNNPELVHALLQTPNGISCINYQDSDGSTPLMCAVENNNCNVVEELLKYDNINVTMWNNYGDSALDTAKDEKDDDCIQQLKEFMKDITMPSYGTPLMQAARENEVDTLQNLLEQQVDVTIKDRLGNTALDWASRRKNVNCVKLLVDYMKKHKLFTLYEAIRDFDDFDYIRYLLGKDSDDVTAIINARSDNGSTPLIQAAYNNKPNSMRALLEYKGIDVNLRNILGKTAMDYARHESMDYARHGCAHILEAYMRANNIGQHDMLLRLLKF